MSAPTYPYRVKIFVPMGTDDEEGTEVVVDLVAYNAPDAWFQALIGVEGRFGLCRMGMAQARVLHVGPRPTGPGMVVGVPVFYGEKGDE